MTGIALPLPELPAALLDDPAVRRRVHRRGDHEEVQFHWWHDPQILPVRWHGSVRLIRWGSKARRGTRLPFGGWVAQDQVAATFGGSAPEPVVIPAALGNDQGTWFLISVGVHGVVVSEHTDPVVYMLTQPSTNYFRNMTQQNPMMPVLVGQVI